MAGPYFILRHGEWWPSRFLLYGDELHCILEIGWSISVLVWKVGTDHVSFDGSAAFRSGVENGPDLWLAPLDQIERRLRDAVAHVWAYNRRVEEWLPSRCRAGRVRRRWTWLTGAPKPLSTRELRRLDRTLAELGPRSGVGNSPGYPILAWCRGRARRARSRSLARAAESRRAR